jgi:hypothetical protein
MAVNMRLRSLFGALLVVLGFGLGTVGAAAKDKKADDKDDKKASDKKAKDKDKDKDKKADDKKAKDKDKDKDKKAKSCSPTCTATCECDGKPIAAAKCSPTCTATCDCDGKPIAAPKCSPTCTATCDCAGRPIAAPKCSPTCTATCDCSGNPIAVSTASTAQALVDSKKLEEEKKKLEEEKKKFEEEKKKKLEEDAKKAAEEQKKAEATPLPAAPIDTLRKDRPDRRKAAVDRLRRRWGSLIADAKAADDLKLHARRVAHLQRIRAVATAKKDKKTVEIVDELLTKEDERHSKTMNSLREGALPGTP